MGFVRNVFHDVSKATGIGGVGGDRAKYQVPPPEPPNINTAANAAQATTDRMRQRRGLLANIYAGSQANTQPTTGSKQLGT